MTELADGTDQLHDFPSTGTVDTAVLASIVESYYPDAVRAGTTARLRAQAAQSAATLFAGAAVASLTLVNFKQLYPQLRIVGCAAVLAWAVASVLYMQAVGAPSPDTDKLRGVSEPDRLVRVVLDRAKAERSSVDRRQRRGNAIAIVALGLTVSTFALAVFSPGYHDEKPAVFTPTAEQLQLMSQNGCSRGENIVGKLRMASLRTDMLEFVIDCGKNRRILVLPKGDVKGLIIYGA
ncbi:hypothetical protein AB0L22_02630 [Micromonospora haikouensis]|uniref:hypothetical protein n=1 Tax=Micromonospora haikouensis TaxID=686309 RepID=UPI003411F8E2